MEGFIEELKLGDLSVRVIVCIGLIILGVGVHYFSKRWITRALSKHSANKLINYKKLNTLTSFVFSTGKYLMYFFIFYIMCKVLKIDIDRYLLPFLGAGGVAFGLGAQTLVKNIINGFFILIEDQYSVGDIITIGGFTGTVEEIGIRTTKIRTVEGNLHIIPNGEISITTNMTKKVAIASVEINLPYEANADTVVSILTDEMANNTGGIDGIINPPQVLGISSLGQYCYTIKILTDSEQAKYLSVERELRLIIMKRLDKEKIPLPRNPAGAPSTMG